MFKSAIYNRAYKLACMSTTYPFKTSAIVFKSKRILSEGINEIRPIAKVNDKYKRFPHSLHAEVAALSKFRPDEIRGASMLILRINGGSKHVSTAKPCYFCQKMLYDYGIKYAYVTNIDGTVIKYEVSDQHKEHLIPIELEGSHNYNDFFIKQVEF